MAAEGKLASLTSLALASPFLAFLVGSLEAGRSLLVVSNLQAESSLGSGSCSEVDLELLGSSPYLDEF